MTIEDGRFEPRKAVNNWLQYLTKKVSFPFEAEVCEYQEGEVISEGDKLKVRGRRLVWSDCFG